MIDQLSADQEGNVVEVLIRDLVERDLPVFFVHQLDADANNMIGSQPRDEEAFMAHWRKNANDPTAVHQTITFAGEVAGNVVSFEMDGQREVGYWLGREFWGRGIGSEALRLFLAKFPQRPLHAHAAKKNFGSVRVLEKCGFRKIGEYVRPGLALGEETEEFVFLLEE